MEVCVPLNRGWGYVKEEAHLNIDQVMDTYAEIRGLDANMLLNIGPLGDGSVYPEDVNTLRELGKRIRARGGA
jgi:alpha-L-fucosidase